jgi:hypothetical protein
MQRARARQLSAGSPWGRRGSLLLLLLLTGASSSTPSYIAAAALISPVCCCRNIPVWIINTNWGVISCAKQPAL